MGTLRRFLSALLPLSLLLLASPGVSQISLPIYVTHVTLAQMYNSGVLVPSASVCATPVDRYGNPISFTSPTWGLVLKGAQFCQNVTNGAFSTSLLVPSSCTTNSPDPIFYNFTVQLLDGSGDPSSVPIQVNGVPNVCGVNYALDTYAPVAASSTALSPPLAQGAGVPTSCTAPSIWLRTDTPSLYTCQGGNYVSISTGTQGPPGTVYGFLSATQNQSSTGSGDGIARAFASCAAGSACTVTAEAGYAADTTRPSVQGGHLIVQSAGMQQEFFYDPYFDSTGSNAGYPFHSLNCVQDHLNGTTGGPANGPLQGVCDYINVVFSPDTPNIGYGGAGAGTTAGQYVAHASTINALMHAAGIWGTENHTIYCAGNGDCQGRGYSYEVYHANGSAGGGENFQHDAAHVNEAQTELQGTIASGGAGATQIRVNCSHDCQFAGNERWLVDWQAPLGTGYVTAAVGVHGNDSGGNQFLGLTAATVTETVPVSTYQGTAVELVDVTQVSNLPISTLTWLRCNDIAGSPTVGSLLGIAGRAQNPLVLASSAIPTYNPATTYAYAQGVTYAGVPYVSLAYNNLGNTPSSSPSTWASRAAGAGQHTIAVSLVMQVYPGSAVFAGGAAGYGMVLDQNNGAYPGTVYPLLYGTHYPLPVLGSTGAHTVVLQHPASSPNQIGNAIFATAPVISVSVTAGVATIVLGADANTTRNSYRWVIHAPSVAITGNSNAALNTQYNSLGDTPNQYPATFSATPCTTLNATTCTTLTGTLTGTGGVITFGGSGYGNTHHALVPITTVRSVNDPLVTPAQIALGVDKATGSYFLVDPNVGTWAAGNQVVESLLATNTGTFVAHQQGAVNPYRSADYLVVNIGGASFSTPTGLNENPAGFTRVYSYVYPQTLQGGGGAGQMAPGFLTATAAGGTGVWSHALKMTYAPFPNYNPFLYFGCPWDGCTDQQYVTPALQMAGRNGDGYLNWNAYANSMMLQGVSIWDFNGAQVYTGDIFGSPGSGALNLHNQVNLPDSAAGIATGGAASICAYGPTGSLGLCGNGGHQSYRYLATLTTGAVASETLSIANLTSANHCMLQQSGSSASVAPLQYVAGPGGVTIYHAATAGATIEVSCDLP